MYTTQVIFEICGHSNQSHVGDFYDLIYDKDIYSDIKKLFGMIHLIRTDFFRFFSFLEMPYKRKLTLP